MNKLFTTIATLALAAMSSMAANETVMHIVLNNGSTSDYTVTEGMKLNFGGAPTSIIGTSESKEVFNIPLQTIKRLYFNDGAGVEGVKAETGKLSLVNGLVDQTLEFTNAPETASDLAIYATDGRRVMTVSNWNGASVDVSSLTTGIYIVATNNAAVKFIKK